VAPAHDALSRASVEEEEEEEEGAQEEGEEVGGSSEGAAPPPLTQELVMEEVKRRFAEEDLEVAAIKYDLEEELFAEIDYAQVRD
jgi:hypothetical protein